MESGLVKVENVDEAIFLALIENGPQTYNELYKKNRKFNKCSLKKFNESLKQLKQDGFVKDKKIGKQLKEFSLNQNYTKNLDVALKQFEEKLEIVRTGEKELEMFTELLNKANTLDKKILKKHILGFEASTNILIILMNLARFYPVFKYTAARPKILLNKFLHLHKIIIQVIDNSLKAVSKMDPKLSEQFFLLLFKKMATNPSLGVSKSSQHFS